MKNVIEVHFMDNETGRFLKLSSDDPSVNIRLEYVHINKSIDEEFNLIDVMVKGDINAYSHRYNMSDPIFDSKNLKYLVVRNDESTQIIHTKNICGRLVIPYDKINEYSIRTI